MVILGVSAVAQTTMPRHSFFENQSVYKAIKRRRTTRPKKPKVLEIYPYAPKEGPSSGLPLSE